MSEIFSCTTPAILLRRIDFCDNDLILTFFSLISGKISMIAKSAKKSRKRFSGAFDLFSLFDIVFTKSKDRLPMLQEAMIRLPFCNIRSDFKKTAYASYFVETVNNWVEPEEAQPQIFDLLCEILNRLDRSEMSDELISIVFQMAISAISGFSPNFATCCMCNAELSSLKEPGIGVNCSKGGLLCLPCSLKVETRDRASLPKLYLSKGTIKQLQWIEGGDWNKIAKMRFSSRSIQESLDFLETFVQYHLGKASNSLSVLNQIRDKVVANGRSPFRPDARCITSEECRDR